MVADDMRVYHMKVTSGPVHEVNHPFIAYEMY
jgi:hypothetical protein